MSVQFCTNQRFLGMSGELTEAQLAQLRQSFQVIDTDHNGLLDKEELTRFMKASGLDVKFVPAIFLLFDTNKDGGLSFDEFKEYLKACLMNGSDPRHFFRLIFNAIDSDGSGSLCAEEMVQFAQLCGKDITMEDALRELAIYDTDHSGSLEFDEVCKAFGI